MLLLDLPDRCGGKQSFFDAILYTSCYKKSGFLRAENMPTPLREEDSGVVLRGMALEEAFGASDNDGDRKSYAEIHVLLYLITCAGMRRM
jgi:hypothetical protein